jgi:inosine/xanthosine triphosphate pyrophosphatase family protein
MLVFIEISALEVGAVNARPQQYSRRFAGRDKSASGGSNNSFPLPRREGIKGRVIR